MKQLEMKIDFQISELTTKNIHIPLLFKPNFSSKKYTVPSHNKIVGLLPVDVKEGSIFVEATRIINGLLIPEFSGKTFKFCHRATHKSPVVNRSIHRNSQIFYEYMYT